MTELDLTALAVQLRSPGGGWVDVGRLTRSNERCSFESDPGFWEQQPRLVLGQVFEEHGPTWRPTARVRLPRWFSHLLPEGRLRQAIAAAAGVKQDREYLLLARIGGDDLPGALRVRAVGDPNGEGSGVAEDVGPAAEAGPFKFSLAGLQLKFSIREGDRGLTLPSRGESGHWIAKLPDGRPGFDGVPEAELAGLELARCSGIPVPEARLVRVDELTGLPEWAVAAGGHALLVRRFDRTDNGRVHVEELAQVLDVPTGHERYKYESANHETVARVTAALCGASSVGSVIDRIVLNVLLGNGDAHVKNWAYRYPDGRTAELSEAYDILPTVLFVPDDDLGLNLGGSRRFDSVTTDSFRRLADRAGWDGDLGRAQAADAVERVVAAWPSLRDRLPRDSFRFLTQRRDRLPLLRS